MIKSAASAADSKTKSRGARSREASRPAAARLPNRCPGASLNLGPLDLVYLEAAQAAEFITTSIFKTSNTVQNFAKLCKTYYRVPHCSKNNIKLNHFSKMHSNHEFSTEARRRRWTWSRGPGMPTNKKHSVFAPLGAGHATIKKLNFQAGTKSAASAASLTAWELHGSEPVGRRPLAKPSP